MLQESRHSHFKDSEKHHCCRVKKGSRSERNGKRSGRNALNHKISPKSLVEKNNQSGYSGKKY
jgi:hypothetical protein